MSASFRLHAVVATLLLVGQAHAQVPMPSFFAVDSKGIVGDLELRKQGFSVARTGTRSCGGKVEGELRVLSARVVTITRSDEEFPTCVLRITFNRNHTRARITENNCSAWHGAGCDFDFNGIALHRRN